LRRQVAGNGKIGAQNSVLPFPVVDRCRNHLATLMKLAMVENAGGFAVGISVMCEAAETGNTHYFRFRQPFPAVGH